MESKAFEEKSLEELEQENNPTLLELYDKALEEMRDDAIAREIVDSYYGSSIMRICHLIEKKRFDFMVEHTSEVLFPGETVMVYPGIKNPVARKIITCDFSGARIYPGSFYVSYRPMVRNIYNGNTYVLSRTLKVECGYEWDLPTTIAEMDALQIKIQNADYIGNQGGIDYTHLSQRLGGDLPFQLLKRRRKYENRIRKRS